MFYFSGRALDFKSWGREFEFHTVAHRTHFFPKSLAVRPQGGQGCQKNEKNPQNPNFWVLGATMKF